MMMDKWKRLISALTWAVRKPSRQEIDSSLPKAIRASRIIVSACEIMIPGVWMLWFNDMPMVLGNGRDSQVTKVHPCAWHSQTSTNEGMCLVTEHTNEYKYIWHVGLGFYSLLTWQEGLVRVTFLVTTTFKKWIIFCNMYGSTPAHSIDEMQSTMFVSCKGHTNRKACNYQGCSIFTAATLTTRL